MSDDPMVWLVEEFGAKVYGDEHKFSYIRHPEATPGDDIWLLFYSDKYKDWGVCDRSIKQPLTRDDVRRLCEIFGVEVRK
jgi:hypothetical protein